MSAAVRQPGVGPMAIVSPERTHTGAGLSDLLEQRAERRPEYRGWCNLCGTPIYPGRRNWYCRSCAAAVGHR